MRAGKLDKRITIETYESGVDEWNQPVEGWVPLGVFRAEVVQSSTEEFFISRGTGEAQTILFRTRHIAGVKLSSRIVYAEQNFNILEIKEIGRRKGLEIRAKAPEGGVTS